MPSSPDFVVENHGSIFLLRPITPSAISWVEEHIGEKTRISTLLAHSCCRAQIHR